MASKLAEKVPGWFTRILMPELVEIKGELKNMNTRFESLDSKIDSKIESLTSKIDSLRNELKADIARVDSRVEDLDKRLDIVQRLTILEAKQRENESRTR